MDEPIEERLRRIEYFGEKKKKPKLGLGKKLLRFGLVLSGIVGVSFGGLKVYDAVNEYMEKVRIERKIRFENYCKRLKEIRNLVERDPLRAESEYHLLEKSVLDESSALFDSLKSEVKELKQKIDEEKEFYLARKRYKEYTNLYENLNRFHPLERLEKKISDELRRIADKQSSRYNQLKNALIELKQKVARKAVWNGLEAAKVAYSEASYCNTVQLCWKILQLVKKNNLQNFENGAKNLYHKALERLLLSWFNPRKLNFSRIILGEGRIFEEEDYSFYYDGASLKFSTNDGRKEVQLPMEGYLLLRKNSYEILLCSWKPATIHHHEDSIKVYFVDMFRYANNDSHLRYLRIDPVFRRYENDFETFRLKYLAKTLDAALKKREYFNLLDKITAPYMKKALSKLNIDSKAVFDQEKMLEPASHISGFAMLMLVLSGMGFVIYLIVNGPPHLKNE